MSHPHTPAVVFPVSGAWLVAGAALLWATAGVAGRFAPGVPAAFLGEARLLLGGLALLIGIGPRRLWRTLPGLPHATLAGAALALAFFQWSFFAAVAYLGAGIAALVSSAAAPFAAEALADWSARRLPSRRWWLDLAGTAAGLLWLMHGSAVSVPGVLVALSGGVAYAVYAGTAARLQDGRAGTGSSLAATALALLAAGLALLPATAHGAAALLSARGLLVCVWLGLGATALAYALFVAGLRQLGAGASLALVQVQPLAAMLLGALLLDERFDAHALLAMGLIAACALHCSFKPGFAPAVHPQ